MTNSNVNHYMASSVSGQADEPNPALQAVVGYPGAKKMALFCLLGITRCVPQERISQKPKQVHKVHK